MITVIQTWRQMRERLLEDIATLPPGSFDPEAIETPHLITTEKTRHNVFVKDPRSGRPVAKTRLTLERPQLITDSVPVLWVPGYGGIKPAYQHTREASAQEGRVSGTWRPIKDLSAIQTFKITHLMHPEVMPRRTLETVIDFTLAETSEDQVDLICHSMGGFIAALAACKDPAKIRQLILVASAGLEDHNLLTLAKRTPRFLWNEFIPHFQTLRTENEARMAWEAIDYFFRNPLRTILEGVAVGSCNIRAALEQARSAGVMIGGILFASDELFIEDNVRAQAEHLFHILDTFDMSEVGHMGPQLQSVGVARHATDISRRLALASEILPKPAV